MQGEQEASADEILHWGPTYLPGMARNLIRRLQRSADFCEIVGTLRKHVAGRPAFRWGSGCSGLDAPGFACAGIQTALGCFNIPVQFVHACAAEVDEWKIEFLRRVHRPRRLLDDLFDMSAGIAMDRISGHNFHTEELKDLDCWFAGFVCKTVSSLNCKNDNQSSGHALQNPESSTGRTCAGVILFIQEHKPKTIVLENVLGLKKNSQHLDVLDKLRSAGYVVEVLQMNPLAYGHPQDRPSLSQQRYR